MSAEGANVLMFAVSCGNVEIVQSLIKHGVDVNAARPKMGTTALMFAANSGQLQIAKMLLEAGAEQIVANAVTE